MTTPGLVILVVSVGSVTALFGWCIWKILTVAGEQEEPEVETPHPSPEE